MEKPSLDFLPKSIDSLKEKEDGLSSLSQKFGIF